MNEKGHNGKSLALAADLTQNAVNKFLSAENKTLGPDALAAVMRVLNISTVLILDADNPLDPTKNDIIEIVHGMDDEVAKDLLQRLRDSGH